MHKVTLNNKEQKRLLVLNEELAGRLAGQERAAETVGASGRFASPGHFVHQPLRLSILPEMASPINNLGQ